MSEEQRRSFAYGNTNIDNPNVTREMVDAAADNLTETPPIIGRLDALREQPEWHNALDDAYDEIRAELLRLQKERDNWQETSREFLRQVDRAVQRYEEILEENNTLAEQRDALLKALKAIETEANTSLEEDEPKYMQGALRSIAGQAWSALNPDKAEPVADVESRE